MPKNIIIPEPEDNLKFVDVHCHLPFPRPRGDRLPSNREQYLNYSKLGGKFLITSTIDIHTLNLTLDFLKEKYKNYGFTCGWAPQTVTYTPKDKYVPEWKKWVDYVKNNNGEFLAIGEVGLDFHHAKTLDKRNKQVEVFKKILELTKDFDKPYVLHVRNAAEHEFDRTHPKHRFNKKDGANREILSILKDYKIPPKKVIWHCFSGPESYGKSLANQGFILSVPSSAYGYNRWRKISKDIPLTSLVTETDAYYQHPYKRGPLNVPANVRYSITAIAYSHGVSQKTVSEKTVQNAVKFFNLKIT
ncbi:MAG: putative deoxyribonuclease YcfH [Candidatus Lokiarchaeum sp. GC14_75]|nr:MAG: putative deoxyribonuclease YcfH [Candidatus Lokiarchaeum sp. GC14_75]